LILRAVRRVQCVYDPTPCIIVFYDAPEAHKHDPLGELRAVRRALCSTWNGIWVVGEGVPCRVPG